MSQFDKMNIYTMSEREMNVLEKWETFMKFNRYKTQNTINLGVETPQR